MKDALIQPIIDKEIFDALHQINDDKNPSIDEFTTKFFKSNQDLLGKEFLTIDHHLFNTKRLLSTLKHTLITLIPKSKHVNTTANFYPMSLYTTFYKVVANILASKIKPILPSIIFNSQSTFIKGRDICDNISLDQEICRELNLGIHGKAFWANLDLKKGF